MITDADVIDPFVLLEQDTLVRHVVEENRHALFSREITTDFEA